MVVTPILCDLDSEIARTVSNCVLQCGCLTPMFMGPFLIISQVNPVTYKLKLLPTMHISPSLHFSFSGHGPGSTEGWNGFFDLPESANDRGCSCSSCFPGDRGSTVPDGLGGILSWGAQLILAGDVLSQEIRGRPLTSGVGHPVFDLVPQRSTLSPWEEG